jgi:hypothetical protein
VKSILVTDQELKTGNSLKNIFKFLHEEYPKARVKTAILTASKISDRINNIDELRSKGKYEGNDENLPEFLAFAYAGRVKTSEYKIN